MKGSPPPPARRIRFEDDEILDFPQLRWSLSHMREFVPTVPVWRGTGAPSDRGAISRGREAAIDELTFDDLGGRRHTWADSLTQTYTDGILVMYRGMRIYERYFGALEPHRPHACFSITKSYVATLAATLIHEGLLDEDKPVPHYLPEMAGTAYEDATLRQVLDMQIGVLYSEDYADPHAQIWDYSRAGGLRTRPADYAGPSNYYEYLVTLRKSGKHGEVFDYKTVNTEVIVLGHASRHRDRPRRHVEPAHLVPDRLRGGRLSRGRFHRRADGRRRLERNPARSVPFRRASAL